MQAQRVPTAIYIRISEDKEGAGLGVERQERECRQLLETMPGYDVVQVFTDNDLSASSGKLRPGYLALLDAMRDGSVQAVVAWHTDRLHRRPVELEEYIKASEERRIPTHTVKAGQIDLATSGGRLVARLLGAVARGEVELKSERQKSKNRQVAHAGLMPSGGPVPWGYNRDRLTLHPEHSTLFRDIHARILAGESLGSIIRWLNEQGVRTPRAQNRWSYSALRSVLVRPLNAGLVMYDGAILTGVQSQWEPLVTVDQHYAMVSLLGDPSRRTTTGNARKHLLAGIAKCGNCLRPLKSGSVGSRSGKVAHLYRCGNVECSARVNVARDQLDALVVQQLLDERGETWVARRKPVEHAGAQLADVETRIAGVTARMGLDDADVAALLVELEDLKAERTRTQSPQSSGWRFTDVWGDWHRAQGITEQREILTDHLACLTVASRGKTSHRFDPERVTLIWQPLPPDNYDPESDLADKQANWH